MQRDFDEWSCVEWAESDCGGERREGDDVTGGGILRGQLIGEDKEFWYY